ncbi:hypothetical protein DTO166G4_4436 [Paecilomyces variotii]|nr:hypothetical protein DTO166G4_4436 [Paecilomyces variotii]KAJ9229962.1 hypothetical protein DTO166G5_7581 [Paecilomyces variotii]KAJ9299189.1 hypothetical protein DTO217A2_8239 [Paecilomyces variotii]
MPRRFIIAAKVDAAFLDPNWGTGIAMSRPLDQSHVLRLTDAFDKQGIHRFDPEHRMIASIPKAEAQKISQSMGIKLGDMSGDSQFILMLFFVTIVITSEHFTISREHFTIFTMVRHGDVVISDPSLMPPPNVTLTRIERSLLPLHSVRRLKQCRWSKVSVPQYSSTLRDTYRNGVLVYVKGNLNDPPCDQCSDLEAIDACQNRDEVKRRGLKMALGPYRRCVSVPGVANVNNTHDTIDHDSSPEELEFESSAEGLPSSTRKRRNNSDVATPLSKRARKKAGQHRRAAILRMNNLGPDETSGLEVLPDETEPNKPSTVWAVDFYNADILAKNPAFRTYLRANRFVAKKDATQGEEFNRVVSAWAQLGRERGQGEYKSVKGFIKNSYFNLLLASL